MATRHEDQNGANAVYQTKKVTCRRGGTNYEKKENKIKDDTALPI